MTTDTVTIPSLANLFWFAEKHGIDEDRCRNILRTHGLTHFDHTAWWTYVGLIKAYRKNMDDGRGFPEDCPVCGAQVERDSKYDGKFGVKWGWRCSENQSHFIEGRVAQLREKLCSST